MPPEHPTAPVVPRHRWMAQGATLRPPQLEKPRKSRLVQHRFFYSMRILWRCSYHPEKNGIRESILALAFQMLQIVGVSLPCWVFLLALSIQDYQFKSSSYSTILSQLQPQEIQKVTQWPKIRSITTTSGRKKKQDLQIEQSVFTGFLKPFRKKTIPKDC